MSICQCCITYKRPDGSTYSKELCSASDHRRDAFLKIAYKAQWLACDDKRVPDWIVDTFYGVIVRRDDMATVAKYVGPPRDKT